MKVTTVRKGREGKGREGKVREGKGREGKVVRAKHFERTE